MKLFFILASTFLCQLTLLATEPQAKRVQVGDPAAHAQLPLKILEDELAKAYKNWEPCPLCGSDPGARYEKHVGLFIPKANAHLVLVPEDSEVYKAIVESFAKESESLKVLKIWRVQSKALTEKYAFKTAQMRLSGQEPNEKQGLYHTTYTAIETLMEQGLDTRVSNSSGFFGAGLYATDSILKASIYWQAQSIYELTSRRTVLQCSMLLGNSDVVAKEEYETAKHKKLRREPAGYHSVQSNLSGQNEFVVYDNSQVRMDYVIDYTIDNDDLYKDDMAAVKTFTPPPPKKS